MQDDDVVIETDGEEETGGSEDELEASESRAETKLTKLRTELEQARKEKQEHLDGWQRAKADYVNALKRFEEEKKSAIELGKVIGVRAFIPTLDSVERAKASGELPEGFLAIAKQLESAATAAGLSQFGKAGDHFDPALHDALGQDPTDSKDQDDVITAVLVPGWKLGDVVIEPAKVRVAHFQG